MTTITQIRKAARALPEVTASTQRGTVSFRVRDRVFVSVGEDDAFRVQLDAGDIDKTLSDLPSSEPLIQLGKSIGVTVPLAAINGMQGNALVRRAWLAQASEHAEPGEQGDLPAALGRPATRGLVAAGVTTLATAAQRSERELGVLHGVGPKALRVLAEAMLSHGLRFREDSD